MKKATTRSLQVMSSGSPSECHSGACRTTQCRCVDGGKYEFVGEATISLCPPARGPHVEVVPEHESKQRPNLGLVVLQTPVVWVQYFRNGLVVKESDLSQGGFTQVLMAEFT